jgi:hypothetical protein
LLPQQPGCVVAVISWLAGLAADRAVVLDSIALPTVLWADGLPQPQVLLCVVMVFSFKLPWYDRHRQSPVGVTAQYHLGFIRFLLPLTASRRVGRSARGFI